MQLMNTMIQLREMLEMGAFDLVAFIDGGLGRLAALTPWEGSA